MRLTLYVMLELHVRSIYVVNIESFEIEPIVSSVTILLESQRGTYHTLWRDDVIGDHDEALVEVKAWLEEAFKKKRPPFRYARTRERLIGD